VGVGRRHCTRYHYLPWWQQLGSSSSRPRRRRRRRRWKQMVLLFCGCRLSSLFLVV
jgi:hypothetical protein